MAIMSVRSFQSDKDQLALNAGLELIEVSITAPAMGNVFLDMARAKALGEALVEWAASVSQAPEPVSSTPWSGTLV